MSTSAPAPDQAPETHPAPAETHPDPAAETRPDPAAETRPVPPAATRAGGPSGWRAAGAVLTAALLLLGVAGVASWLVRKTEVVNRTYHHTVSRLVIDSGSGDVSVTAGPAGEVFLHERLEWSWTRPVERAGWDGDTLRLSFRCPPVSLGPGCGINYRVRVPAGTVVEADTGAGDVTVQGLTAAATLSTGSGDIAVSGLSGTVAMRTGSGDVTASDLDATRVTARTGSGGVALRFAGAPDVVSAETGSGDVTIEVPPGRAYRVATGTGSGDVSVGVDRSGDAAGSLTARTGSGDISIDHP